MFNLVFNLRHTGITTTFVHLYVGGGGGAGLEKSGNRCPTQKVFAFLPHTKAPCNWTEYAGYLSAILVINQDQLEF